MFFTIAIFDIDTIYRSLRMSGENLRIADVCDLRLDFEMFAIRSATGTDELGTCADTFTVTTVRNATDIQLCPTWI